MKTIEKATVSIDDVKNEIMSNIGKHILIKESNRQGKKIKEYSGEILDAYASLFLVKVEVRSSHINKSFSYVDFLTNEMTFKIV